MAISSSSPALIGGLPTRHTDIPICACFIPIFLTLSVLNATLFFHNLRRKHKKFIPSWLLNVFCLIRITTCSVRIAWALDPTNSHLAVAAQVFNNAGVIFLYILNLLFAQRILRARQPGVGWNKGLSWGVRAVFAGIVAALVMGITGLIISVNTHDAGTLRRIRDIGLATSTYTVVVTILPFVFMGLAFFLPEARDAENFGTGSMKGKIRVLLVTGCLAVVIAGFKAGTTWERPRKAADPAWYDAKAAFYCFGFVLEVVVVAVFTAARIDRRFYVPDGCHGPGDYSRLAVEGSENGGPGKVLIEEGIALGKL